MSSTNTHNRIEKASELAKFADKASELIAKLNLEEKVELLTGFDFWNVAPNAKIGLRKILLSDGPSGVRGEFWDERDNSLNLTSGTALGSSWSVEFAAEYGRTLAREAVRKGVDVVLGPTINLHRSPLGGRHFECLSEDAMLTGALATSYTQALQSLGKGACPKHFVANDFETDRYNVDVRVDERTLREVYLRPFEDTVEIGGAWSIMSSYNQVNGTTLTEHELLQSPLRDEWGFDGLVISDWTAVRSLKSAEAEQDLAMPGPAGPWGEALVAAVRAGQIDEATIDRKIERLLVLAQRVGALGLEGEAPEAPQRHNDIALEGVSFARRAAIEGSVLLKNDGILPLNLLKAGKVALIGHNADAARTQGGGSATVMPTNVVTPLSALRSELGANLSYSIGAVVQEGIAPLDSSLITNTVTGKPGVQVDFLDDSGGIIHSEERLATTVTWLGSGAPVIEAAAIRFRTIYRPAMSSEQLLGFATVQPVEFDVDGENFLSHHQPDGSGDPFLGLMDPPFATRMYKFEKGVNVEIDINVDLKNREGLALIAQSFTFGLAADTTVGDTNIAEAVRAATEADLAIVVVGTNAKVESEGFDRQNLDLPGRQNELVEAVLKANPNTIVIVNSGSPVLMPWRNRVRAVLLTYFGGQEMGNALVDMLSGAAEPGGRLPTTWPATLEDLPVSNCAAAQPGNFVAYEEGIHIGYRAWLKAGRVPAYEFGFGLGYTSWNIDLLDVPPTVNAAEDFNAIVAVTNTGHREGKHVVQIYASRKNSSIDRPVRWLVGFAEVHANPGETKAVTVNIRGREFADWNNGWNFEPGTFDLHAGSSVEKLEAHSSVSIS
jgi:beta-glucosidase